MKQIKINIRGKEDKIIVDKFTGDPIIESWLRYKNSKVSERPGLNVALRLNGFTGTVSDISNFEELQSAIAETKTFEAGMARDNAERARKRNSVPEIKATWVEAYKTAYWSITGYLPDQDLINKVKVRQLVFFRENPKRLIAGIECWDLPTPKKQSLGQLETIGKAGLLEIIGRSINQDRVEVKYL